MDIQITNETRNSLLGTSSRRLAFALCEVMGTDWQGKVDELQDALILYGIGISMQAETMRTEARIKAARQEADQTTQEIDDAVLKAVPASPGCATSTSIAHAMGWQDGRNVQHALRRLREVGLVEVYDGYWSKT